MPGLNQLYGDVRVQGKPGKTMNTTAIAALDHTCSMVDSFDANTFY